MLIISDFRDYYDYIGRQYPDQKIVYRRHCVEYETAGASGREYKLVQPHKADVVKSFEALVWAKIHFCGMAQPLMWQAGEAQYDLEAIFETLMAIQQENVPRSTHFGAVNFSYWGETLAGFKANNAPKPTDVNRALDAPVVLQVGSGTFYTNIRLASINYAHILPPEQAFMHIYNFIIPADVQPDANPDNMDRYQAKGFDLKTSFRKGK